MFGFYWQKTDYAFEYFPTYMLSYPPGYPPTRSVIRLPWHRPGYPPM